MYAVGHVLSYLAVHKLLSALFRYLWESFSSFIRSPLSQESSLEATCTRNRSPGLTLDFSLGLGIHYLGSEHPSRPKIRYGNHESDRQSGKYNYAWESWEAFVRFLEKEEETGSIELRKVKTIIGAERYVKRTQYVCARAGPGGQKGCTKKNPDWDRKVKSKLTECPCLLWHRRHARKLSR